MFNAFEFNNARKGGFFELTANNYKKGVLRLIAYSFMWFRTLSVFYTHIDN